MQLSRSLPFVKTPDGKRLYLGAGQLVASRTIKANVVFEYDDVAVKKEMVWKAGKPLTDNMVELGMAQAVDAGALGKEIVAAEGLKKEGDSGIHIEFDVKGRNDVTIIVRKTSSTEMLPHSVDQPEIFSGTAYNLEEVLFYALPPEEAGMAGKWPLPFVPLDYGFISPTKSEQSVFQVILRMKSLAGFRRYPAKPHAFQLGDGVNYSHWGAGGNEKTAVGQEISLPIPSMAQQETIISQPPILQQLGFPGGILSEGQMAMSAASPNPGGAGTPQNSGREQPAGRFAAAKKKRGTGASKSVAGQSSSNPHALRHTFGKGKPIPFSRLSGFKAVIFDFDGVVGDTMELHRKSFNGLLAPFGIRIGKKEFRNYGGRRAETIIQGLFDRHGIKESAAEWDGKRTQLYGQYLQKYGAKPIPGFVAFQSMLKRNGIKTAVASSGEEPHVKNALKHMNVSMPFVTVRHVRHAKPAPDLFLLAAKKLSVEPMNCVVVEDALSGIEAARRAEMPCIALSTTLPAHELKSRATLAVKDFNSPVLAKLIPKLLMKNRAADEKDAPVKATRASRIRKNKTKGKLAVRTPKKKLRKKSVLPIGKKIANGKKSKRSASKKKNLPRALLRLRGR